ncbi:MAG: bile acid:sodium symporter family protein [Bacteroidota bacterium]
MGKSLILNEIVNLFPVWILLGSILALVHPPIFLWFKPYVATGLMIIMLGMGLTLRLDDFRRVLKNPKYVGLAALLQFSVMPLLGWGIGKLFGLEQALAVGLIIVACCPGGTASNVICYLARVNVALSVSMTAVSTLAAVMMTPILSTFLIGDTIKVSAWSLFYGTAKVVLIPVILGILISQYFPRIAKKITPFSPLVALIFILLIIGAIMGEDRALLLASGLKLLGAVITLHVLGFVLGYLLSKLLVKDEQVSRTVGIEVSMQNAGLGAVLAKDHFPTLIGAAAPCALAGSVHNIVGSVLVWVFRKYPTKDGDSWKT